MTAISGFTGPVGSVRRGQVLPAQLCHDLTPVERAETATSPEEQRRISCGDRPEVVDCRQFHLGSSRVCPSVMARPLRVQAPGLTYHIIARGNDRMAIYTDDADRHEFLDRLSVVVDDHDLHCHAYCLMTNHYHLLATTPAANLSKAVRQLNGTYAQWWNRRWRRVGHVFQGRFGAQIVQRESYFLTVCRYIVLNPVRAGLVDLPEKWPWSSYRATAGLAGTPSFLRPDLLLQDLAGGNWRQAFIRYRRFVLSGMGTPGRLPPGAVLGDETFLMQFRARAAAASREVPRPERALRPSLSELFAGAVTRTRRNAQAMAAYRYGYSMAEIARHLELHYATISKMIAAARGGVRS